MPLLKRQPDLFPQDLFDLPVESHPWWVAHVKSRQEKELARHLQPLGIPYYLPQREQKIRRVGRKFVSYFPLFPGYLFFRGTRDDRYAAMVGTTGHSRVPLRIATFAGFSLSALSFLVAAGSFVYKLIFWNSFPVAAGPLPVSGAAWVGGDELAGGGDNNPSLCYSRCDAKS